MSFFLIDRTPSEELMLQAEDGDLDTPDGIRTVAWQMVESNLARTAVRNFYDEYLRVRELATKGKDSDLFPLFTPELADAMREETLLLVEDVVFNLDSDVLGLLDSEYTFINSDLAELYGVESPAPGTWTNRELPGSQARAGVLTHGGWLAMTSHNNVNSPTRRGLFVQEEILCTAVPPAPPEVTPEPVIPQKGQTLREALGQHQKDPSCAACHSIMDPLGFAFEFYSPIGEYRTMDNGGEVDASGDIEGLGEWNTAAELATILRNDPRTSQCLVNKFYTFGLGYAPTVDQGAALIAVEADFASSEHNLKTMLVELVASPLFRLVDEPK